MTTTTMTQSTTFQVVGLDVEAISRRLPDLEPASTGSAGLSGQRGQHAEAAPGDRRDEALLREHPRQRPRGVHTLSEDATAQYEGARAKAGGSSAPVAPEIIWTRNATEA